MPSENRSQVDLGHCTNLTGMGETWLHFNLHCVDNFFIYLSPPRPRHRKPPWNESLGDRDCGCVCCHSGITLWRIKGHVIKVSCPCWVITAPLSKSLQQWSKGSLDRGFHLADCGKLEYKQEWESFGLSRFDIIFWFSIQNLTWCRTRFVQHMNFKFESYLNSNDVDTQS